MSPSSTRDFTVLGIGPVGELTFSFGRGVNVLRGPNGAGKTRFLDATHAGIAGGLDAARRASGRRFDVEASDGLAAAEERGEVREAGRGVLLRVGRSVRRGESASSVCLAETWGLRDMVSPAGKTPATREKQRRDALLRVAGDLDRREELLRFCDGDEMIAAAVIASPKVPRAGLIPLVAAADAMRAHGQAKAREAEADRDVARYASQVAQEGSEEQSADAEALLEEAREFSSDLADQCVRENCAESVCRERAAAADQIVADLNVRRSSAATAKAIELPPERPDLARIESRGRELAAKVERLRAELSAAEAAAAETRAEYKAARETVRAWDGRQAVLDQEPSVQEIADAKSQAAAWRVLERFRRATKEAQAHGVVELRESEAAQRSADLAERWRRFATDGVSASVNRRLSACEFGPLRFDGDESLCRLNADGVLEAFDRLSFGERVSLVFEHVVPVMSGVAEGPLWVPLEPDFWAALDERHRDALDEALRALPQAVYAVTEEPAAGCEMHVLRWGSRADPDHAREVRAAFDRGGHAVGPIPQLPPKVVEDAAEEWARDESCDESRGDSR